MDTQNLQSTSTAIQHFSLNKKELSNLIHHAGVAEITFLKKDGSERLIKATLSDEFIVPYERKTNREKKSNDSVLSVWDLDKNSWRAINVKSITKIYYRRDDDNSTSN